MTNINRTRWPKLMLLALALLVMQALRPCFAQQPTAPRGSRSDDIQRRLERIEQSLKNIEAKGNAAGTPQSDRDRATRLNRGETFRLPDAFRVRALSTDTDATTLSATASGLEPDRDGDGLTDAEEAAIGTDPENRDTDGDALWDGWEVHTIDGLDLRSLGASPLHKDIFVEMDFMRRASATNGLAPSDAVLRGIEAVFTAASVQNPDGFTGINIHLVMGNEVPYDADLNPYFTEFSRLRNSNFDPKRARAFHYMIWANGYDGGTSSGISMDIPHSEFIVTLGTWNNNQGGTDAQKIGTFVHELGHNLGRTHGGSDHSNFKSNHLSVMNYYFQTRGLLHNGTRIFDYQRFSVPSLDEGNLLEADGLGRSPALAGYSTIFRLPSGALKEVACDDAIDWNRNGSTDTDHVMVDLDQDTQLGEMSETPDEWSALVFNGGVIGKKFPVAGIFERSTRLYDRLPVIELTEEQDKLIESRMQGESRQP